LPKSLVKARNPQSVLNQAIGFHQTGNLADAERLYVDVMRAAPREAAAPHLLGVVRAQQGRNAEALELIGAALMLKPDAPEMLSNQGNVLKALGRFAEALASYDRALAVNPDYVAAQAKRAQVLRDLGRLDDALASSDAALKMNPGFAEAHSNRGVILSDLRRHDEALASYDRALAVAPQFPDVWNNRALTLKAMKRLVEALANAERALSLHPGFAEAWNNRGIILFDLKRTGDAIASYDRVLELQSGHAEALNNRAVALASLKRFPEALADCDRALLVRPAFADALYNRGNALSELGRPQDALTSYEQALVADPAHPSALSGLANAALLTGDWARTRALGEVLKADVLAGKSVIQPFVLMGYHDDNDLHLRCARNYVRQVGPGPQPPLWAGEKYGHDRIRIAYLSADFHQHVTAALTVEMFEQHDREQFEITAVSFGPDDGSDMRARLVGSFDRFHDARAQTDREVAQLLRRWEIDIAVDLGGHTSGARPWVLAHRPCPVQAKYMGYPGTSGTNFIDWLVADSGVVPADQEQYFSEKIAILPDTLWVTDTTVAVPPPPSRAEAGLPDRGFVFCCFNHNWKITAPLFDIWMRLLDQVDDSVLWLLEGNAAIRGNLQREAEARGIDPSRLVFAARTTPKKHLARQQLADLFLDTLPYNAHTTASDALWAGLPIITLPGHSFPARVAASILQAAGLPELIVPDFATYEARALQLAREPETLRGVCEKLVLMRKTPLFDTVRFTRNLESAYRTMLEQA
jgi:protein O-GlcNAc transferase